VRGSKKEKVKREGGINIERSKVKTDRGNRQKSIEINREREREEVREQGSGERDIDRERRGDKKRD
jgi:hypothetical protein